MSNNDDKRNKKRELLKDKDKKIQGQMELKRIKKTNSEDAAEATNDFDGESASKENDTGFHTAKISHGHGTPKSTAHKPSTSNSTDDIYKSTNKNSYAKDMKNDQSTDEATRVKNIPKVMSSNNSNVDDRKNSSNSCGTPNTKNVWTQANTSQKLFGNISSSSYSTENRADAKDYIGGQVSKSKNTQDGISVNMSKNSLKYSKRNSAVHHATEANVSEKRTDGGDDPDKFETYNSTHQISKEPKEVKGADVVISSNGFDDVYRTPGAENIVDQKIQKEDEEAKMNTAMTHNVFKMRTKVLLMEFQIAVDARKAIENKPINNVEPKSIQFKSELSSQDEDKIKSFVNMSQTSLSLSNLYFADKYLVKAEKVLAEVQNKAKEKNEPGQKSNQFSNPENEFTEKPQHVPKYRPEVSIKGDKEEVDKCIRVAQTAISTGNLKKAEKFLLKAERMGPASSASDLLSYVRNLMESKNKPTENADVNTVQTVIKESDLSHETSKKVVETDTKLQEKDIDINKVVISDKNLEPSSTMLTKIISSFANWGKDKTSEEAELQKTERKAQMYLNEGLNYMLSGDMESAEQNFVVAQSVCSSDLGFDLLRQIQDTKINKELLNRSYLTKNKNKYSSYATTMTDEYAKNETKKLYDTAMDAFASEDFEKAERLFQKVQRMFPDFPEVDKMLREVRIAAKSSRHAYRETVKISPSTCKMTKEGSRNANNESSNSNFGTSNMGKPCGSLNIEGHEKGKEDNETDADKCIKIAEKAFANEEFNKCERFLLKARRIDQNIDVEYLLSRIRLARASRSSSESMSKKTCKSENDYSEKSLSSNLDELDENSKDLKYVEIGQHALEFENLENSNQIMQEARMKNLNSPVKKFFKQVQAEAQKVQSEKIPNNSNLENRRRENFSNQPSQCSHRILECKDEAKILFYEAQTAFANGDNDKAEGLLQKAKSMESSEITNNFLNEVRAAKKSSKGFERDGKGSFRCENVFEYEPYQHYRPTDPEMVNQNKENSTQCIVIAQEAFRIGDYAKCEKMLLKAERLYPTTLAQNLLEQVHEAMNKKQGYKDLLSEGSSEQNLNGATPHRPPVDSAVGAEDKKTKSNICYNLALEAHNSNDLEKAEILSVKADNLYRTQRTEELLIRVWIDLGFLKIKKEALKRLSYNLENMIQIKKMVSENYVQMGLNACKVGDSKHAEFFLTKAKIIYPVAAIGELQSQIMNLKSSECNFDARDKKKTQATWNNSNCKFAEKCENLQGNNPNKKSTDNQQDIVNEHVKNALEANDAGKIDNAISILIIAKKLDSSGFVVKLLNTLENARSLILKSEETSSRTISTVSKNVTKKRVQPERRTKSNITENDNKRSRANTLTDQAKYALFSKRYDRAEELVREAQELCPTYRAAQLQVEILVHANKKDKRREPWR